MLLPPKSSAISLQGRSQVTSSGVPDIVALQGEHPERIVSLHSGPESRCSFNPDVVRAQRNCPEHCFAPAMQPGSERHWTRSSSCSSRASQVSCSGPTLQPGSERRRARCCCRERLVPLQRPRELVCVSCYEPSVPQPEVRESGVERQSCCQLAHPNRRRHVVQLGELRVVGCEMFQQLLPTFLEKALRSSCRTQVTRSQHAWAERRTTVGSLTALWVPAAMLVFSTPRGERS